MEWLRSINCSDKISEIGIMKYGLVSILYTTLFCCDLYGIDDTWILGADVEYRILEEESMVNSVMGLMGILYKDKK